MKQGLLVVLAVAVAAALLGLSDGRNVTVCELRQTLATTIVLPPYLQKYKESILAAVICNVKLMSQLNSGLVTVKGTRTTTPQPTTTTTSETTTPQPTTTSETTTPQPTTTTTSETTTPQPTTTTTSETTTPQPTTTTTSETTTPQPTTTSETTTPQPTTTTTSETTTPALTTEATTTTAFMSTGGRRRKRAVPISIKEQNVLDENLMKLVRNEHLSLFNEDDYNQYNSIGRWHDSHEDDSHEDDDHKPKKGPGGRTQPWSLGFYGLFQLSDGYFCSSGYRPSKDVCVTDCSAFTDDDIMDDVACLLNTNYWWYLLEKAPKSCFNTRAFAQQASTCGV